MCVDRGIFLKYVIQKVVSYHNGKKIFAVNNSKMKRIQDTMLKKNEISIRDNVCFDRSIHKIINKYTK